MAKKRPTKAPKSKKPVGPLGLALNDCGTLAKKAVPRLFELINSITEASELLNQGRPAAEIASAYVGLRGAVDEMTAVMKALNGLKERYQYDMLPGAMQREGIQTVTLDSGDRLSISARVFASIPADKREEAYEWLRANDMGALITATVNASTLSATAKTMMADNNELPASLFKVEVLPSVSLTRARDGASVPSATRRA